jgi:type II secretory pathway pseudopilin PulG
MTTGPRRAGLTLTEVVVTLAILAFGTLAILTLFPLAAAQMAIAVKEDRSGQHAAAAAAQFKAYWKHEVVEPIGTGPPGTDEDVFHALTDPNTGVDPGFPVTGKGLPVAQPDEPSYPVVVDTMGWAARNGLGQSWFGDGGATNVPRRTLVNTVRAAPAGPERTRFALRVGSLMDGLGYTEDGEPRVPGPAPFVADRELRYNYLLVVQRPSERNRYAANLTVVVFDNRPHLYAPAGAELVVDTVANGVTPDGRTTAVTLNGGTGGLKPGGFVMDATVNPAGRPLVRHANVYQVVSITGSTLELQPPLKPATDGSAAPYTGRFVILPGACGAYTRAPLSAE